MVKKTENLVNQLNFMSVDKLKTRVSGSNFEKTMQAATANSAKKDAATDTVKTGSTDQTAKTQKGKAVERAVEQMQNPVKKDVAQAEPEEMTGEEVLAVVQTMITEVKQQLLDLFSVTEGELSSVMENLGITEQDLLNPQSMTDLVMELSGAESPMELLFNPEITALLTETKENFGNLMEEAAKAGLDTENILTEQKEVTVQEESFVPEETFVQETAPVQEKVEVVADKDRNAGKEEIPADSAEQAVQTESKENVPAVSEKNSGKQEKNFNGETQSFSAQILSELEEAVGERLPEVDTQDVIYQVVEKIKLTAKADTSSFELQLNPEHLGKINLQVAAKNGVVTAQIATETIEAKEILEAQLSTLKETLNNQGVKVEAVEVSVGARSFDENLDGQADNQNQADSRGRQRRFRFDLMDAEEGELTSAEQIAREIMMANGNRIDYSA